MNSYSCRLKQVMVDDSTSSHSLIIHLLVMLKYIDRLLDLYQLKIDLYDRSFVYFKPALVGGVTTSEELALMGRKTVSRTKGNFYLSYNSIEQACEIIENQAKNIGKTVGSVLNENYFDTGEEWKQVKFWLC